MTIDKENVTQDSIKESENKVSQDLSNLEVKLKEQEKLSNDYLEQLKKAQADFINYKNRIDKETKDSVFLEQKKLICEFLGFRHTLKLAIDHETNETNKQNLEQLISNFDNILKRQNISKIECKNKEFDLEICDCISRIKINKEEDHNKVLDVVEDGYLLKEKLIKPAKVVVGVKEE